MLLFVTGNAEEAMEDKLMQLPLVADVITCHPENRSGSSFRTPGCANSWPRCKAAMCTCEV